MSADATIEFDLGDEAATAAFGARLSRALTPGDVVGLTGPLGAGKTALARGLIRSAMGEPSEEVPSPTFTLVQTYPAREFDIWHFDLYRLENPEEIFELGWDEASEAGVCLVEWPERMGALWPARALHAALTISPGQQTGRVVRLTGAGEYWGHRFEHF